MFKTRLLQLFRKLRKAEPTSEDTPVVQDLQSRLQHLTELFPGEEPNADSPQVTIYDVDLTDDADLIEQERLREEERKSLNSWIHKHRKNDKNDKTTTAEKAAAERRFSFEYEVDPIRTAVRDAESSGSGPNTKQARLGSSASRDLKKQIFDNEDLSSVARSRAEIQSRASNPFGVADLFRRDTLIKDDGALRLDKSKLKTQLEKQKSTGGKKDDVGQISKENLTAIASELIARSSSTNNSPIRAIERLRPKKNAQEFESLKTELSLSMPMPGLETERKDEPPSIIAPKTQAASTAHQNADSLKSTSAVSEAGSTSKSEAVSKAYTTFKAEAVSRAVVTSKAEAVSKADSASKAEAAPKRVALPLISETAVRQMMRHELQNKTLFSRSLDVTDDTIEDTTLADQWDCLSSNSLFALPDESTSYEATAEYEEDYEEDLLPYFSETLLLSEDELATNSQVDLAAVPAQQSHAQKVDGNESRPAAASMPTAATESSTTIQPYNNLSENALKLIAQKPETPAPTLKWLASHTNPHIRAAVAKNPSTPGDTITVLAKDHEAGIRHSIAENLLSSMDALNLLVKDRNPLIAWRAKNTVSVIQDQQRVAQRAKEAALQEAQKEAHHHMREAKIATTEETIAFLQVIARKTNTPVRRLDELARHSDVRVRAAVAENANAPADLLWLLSKDADSSVKTKVTDNYNCPIEILEAMKEDDDAYVAYQAHSQLNRVLGSGFGDVHIRTATWP